MNLMNILLMAPPAGQQSNPIMQFLPIILIGVVFYFFMIRPQTKKAKEQKNFLENLKKGDKIVTLGGIHGKIIELHDTTMMIEIDNNVRVKVERSAISLEATKNAEKASA